MPDTENATSIEILATQVSFLREDIRDLAKKVDESNDNKVSHREWSQRNEHVNTRLGGLGREIGDLRIELRAKSAPWWSVGAMLASIIAVAWTILGPN